MTAEPTWLAISDFLQRVENVESIVILQSNLKAHIDPAFARRSHSIIPFPMADARDRPQLWQNTFPKTERLRVRPETYEPNGGAIVNVPRHAARVALHKGALAITLKDIEHGTARELRKGARAA